MVLLNTWGKGWRGGKKTNQIILEKTVEKGLTFEFGCDIMEEVEARHLL